MFQYLPDHYRVFDAGYDPHRALTLLTDFDVDVEDPLQPLGPGHGTMALGRCPFVVVSGDQIILAALATSGWRDGCSVMEVFLLLSQQNLKRISAPFGFLSRGSSVMVRMHAPLQNYHA